jgi:membrane-associated protease RseP (regulator of RpoE activity)
MLVECFFLCLRDRDLLSDQESQNQESEQRRIDFKFPLLTIRTKVFSGVFDRLGSFRASRYISWAALFVVPFVAAIGLYLIVGSLFALLSNPAVGSVARELGPGSILLLPGINPILPIVYGWVAIVCAIAIHEGAHGVVARSAGLRVKSSGLLFFLIIPIGAFVDVDEEQIKKARPRASLRVMAAGVGGNVAVAAVCLIGVLLIVGSLTPVVNGVYISSVNQGMPAQAAGLLPKDVLVSIDNVKIYNTTDLRSFLNNKTAGEIVRVAVERGNKWQTQYSTLVNLTVSNGSTVMGINVGDLMTEERLKNYQTFTPERLSMYLVPPTLASGLVPFSDSLAPFYTSSLDPNWEIIANTLFWLWFVNFNLALFNALPIYPLDGGRMFNIALKGAAGRKVSERTISMATYAVTAICVIIVVMVTVVPFIG